MISLDDLLLLETSGATRSSGMISAPEDCEGFFIYGPYKELVSGLYEVSLRLARPAGRIGCLTLDVFSKGSILAQVDFLNTDDEVKLLFVAPAENLIELRIQSRRAAVSLTYVSVDLATPFRLGEHRPAWKSRVGELVLNRIVQPVAVPDGIPFSPIQAAELLFNRADMLKIALPEIGSVEDELIRRGIDPLLARALFEDVGYAEWPGSEIAVPDLIAFPAVRHTFQSQMVDQGRLRMMSPVTGGWVECKSSLPIVAGDHLPIAYEFFGDAPMVAFANAGWGGAMSFVWLIEQDVLLIDDRNWCIGFDGPSLVTQYLHLCELHRDALKDYRLTDKTVAAVSGYQPNMGHFYWNDVSGLEREMRLSRLGKVARIYQRPKLWSGIGDLYPEVADRVEEIEAAHLLPRVLAERQLAVRLTASAIDLTLAKRIHASARRALGARDPARLVKVETLLAAPDRFKLFLNLRAHNKAWIEQVEGLSAVIEVAIARCPSVIVYLDGWVDCRETADALRRSFADRCTVVDGLAASFGETLLWSFGCDAYVAVIGSGLVPLTWLGDRPGVAHSNTGHDDQIASFWGRVRASSQPLLKPTLDQINDDGPGIYANYSIDPAIISELFSRLLDGLEADPTSPPRRGLISSLRQNIGSRLRSA